MVPFVVLACVIAMAGTFFRSPGGRPAEDLCVVLRVCDAADTLEAMLREAHAAGIARVIVVDEGSTDITWQIAHAWARARPWVQVCHRLEIGELPAAALVLDARLSPTARHAATLLHWLASGRTGGQTRVSKC